MKVRPRNTMWNTPPMHIKTFQNKVLAFLKLINAKMIPIIAKTRIQFIIEVGTKPPPACPGGGFKITQPKKDKHINRRFTMLTLSETIPQMIPDMYIILI